MEVSEERITEFDWWQEAFLEDLKIALTPSRHMSGRGLTDQSANRCDPASCTGWYSGFFSCRILHKRIANRVIYELELYT